MSACFKMLIISVLVCLAKSGVYLICTVLLSNLSGLALGLALVGSTIIYGFPVATGLLWLWLKLSELRHPRGGGSGGDSPNSRLPAKQTRTTQRGAANGERDLQCIGIDQPILPVNSLPVPFHRSG